MSKIVIEIADIEKAQTGEIPVWDAKRKCFIMKTIGAIAKDLYEKHRKTNERIDDTNKRIDKVEEKAQERVDKINKTLEKHHKALQILTGEEL